MTTLRMLVVKLSPGTQASSLFNLDKLLARIRINQDLVWVEAMTT